MRKKLLFIVLIVFLLNFMLSEDSSLYIEYNRGWSSPTNTDIKFSSKDLNFEIKDVHLIDNSFFPDNSIIPNAFIKPLLKLDIVGAIKSTTEPYYGIRVFYFLSNSSKFGFGIDFIHFKVFVPDSSQTVFIKGSIFDENISSYEDIHKTIKYFNVSHGVNLIGLTVIYRKQFKKIKKIPDGKVQPYISLALGPCIPHTELKFSWDREPANYSYEIRWGNYGAGLSAGVRLHVKKHLGFYLESKLVYTNLANLSFYNGEGKISMRFSTFHILWGVSYIK